MTDMSWIQLKIPGMKPAVMQEEKCKTQGGMTTLNRQRMNPPSIQDIWNRKVKGILSDSHVSNSAHAGGNCNSYGNSGRPCFEENSQCKFQKILVI